MKKLFIPTVLIVALLGAYGTYYFYKQYQETKKLIKNPVEIGKAEEKQIISDVGKLLVLPKDETPTVVTVVDKSKLKSQKFFDKSENGDKVLIFLKARKAILYRPSSNKIVDVAGVTIEQNKEATKSADQKKTTVTPTQKPTEPKPSPVEDLTPEPTEEAE